MGFKCGIVGLPNVGKSTLFNALTNSSKAQAENFPFCTIDPNLGVVPVEDERLDNLTNISNSKKKIYTTISFVDIAGLVKGASKGEGLGNKFLSHIREVDAIIHMIRCFDSDDIQNVNAIGGPTDKVKEIWVENFYADNLLGITSIATNQLDVATLNVTGEITETSSAELKTNIEPIGGALNKVMALQGVKYNWINKENERKEYGLIAENVAEIIPNLASFENNKASGVKYSKVVALLIEAIKEQQHEINELKKNQS